MLAKRAHCDFPRLLLGEPNLEHGRWIACSTVKDEIKLQACLLKDLKVKNFILTCSTSVPGNMGVTCRCGLVNCPQVTESYLKYATFIDIHNHYCTGSCGVEDIWHTKKPHRQQFGRVLGFCFTHNFLKYKYFCNKNIEHYQFKMVAVTAQALMYHKRTRLCETRGSLNTSLEDPVHNLA